MLPPKIESNSVDGKKFFNFTRHEIKNKTLFKEYEKCDFFFLTKKPNKKFYNRENKSSPVFRAGKAEI